jgi:hypothetical protein
MRKHDWHRLLHMDAHACAWCGLYITGMDELVAPKVAEAVRNSPCEPEKELEDIRSVTGTMLLQGIGAKDLERAPFVDEEVKDESKDRESV